MKKHEAKSFNYKPRYYDAEKESLLHKIKSAEQKESETPVESADINKDLTKLRIREELRRAKDNRRQHRGLWNGSNLRLIAIIIGLLLIAYYLLHRFLPAFIDYLSTNP